MKNVMELQRAWFQDLKKEEPERYQEIVDTECPEMYALPSYHDTGTCVGKNKCSRCWKEALGYATGKSDA